MDGRSHPANALRTACSHSIGWWEGDTLVSDTTNFHEASGSIARVCRTPNGCTPSSAGRARTTAPWSTPLTVDDPGAYSARWTTSVILTWEPNTELFEYVCQQQNYAHELMVGEMKSVDRATVVVP